MQPTFAFVAVIADGPESAGKRAAQAIGLWGRGTKIVDPQPPLDTKELGGEALAVLDKCHEAQVGEFNHYHSRAFAEAGKEERAAFASLISKPTLAQEASDGQKDFFLSLSRLCEIAAGVFSPSLVFLDATGSHPSAKVGYVRGLVKGGAKDVWLVPVTLAYPGQSLTGGST